MVFQAENERLGRDPDFGLGTQTVSRADLEAQGQLPASTYDASLGLDYDELLEVLTAEIPLDKKHASETVARLKMLETRMPGFKYRICIDKGVLKGCDVCIHMPISMQVSHLVLAE